MSAIEHGCSVEDLALRPTLMTVTNVNSPRRVDEEILDNIITMARHGQAVVITPFTLMGAMAPVTLAGALVQQTAEAMGIIALCQIVRPELRATGYGFMNLVSISCGGFADWGFGVLRDEHVPLNVIFGVFAGVALLSVFIVLSIRPVLTRDK